MATFDEIAAALRENNNIRQVARKLHVGYDRVAIVRASIGLPTNHHPPQPDPTPEEIKARAEEVRKEGFVNSRGEKYKPWDDERYEESGDRHPSVVRLKRDRRWNGQHM